ncbi:hypothetical protein CR513_01247, partial [Mucuna pruriens]
MNADEAKRLSKRDTFEIYIFIEGRGLCLSRSTTKYMHCKFSKKQEQNDLEIKMGKDDVTHKILVGWLKWRKSFRIVCGKVPTKLKRKFYRTAIHLTILYGNEWWALKGQQEEKVRIV